MKNTKKFLGTFENLAQAPMRSMAVPPPGVQHAVGHGGRMPLQISIQGGENRSLQERGGANWNSGGHSGQLQNLFALPVFHSLFHP